MSIAFTFFSAGAWFLLFLLDTAGAQAVGSTNAMNTFLQFDIITERQADLLFLSFSYPSFNGAWFIAAFNIASFNQWMFAGWAMWIRLIIFLPLLVAFAMPLVLSLLSAVLTRFRG
jgi:hypothetical protein